MVPVGLFVVGGPVASYIERLAPSSPEPMVPLLLIVMVQQLELAAADYPAAIHPAAVSKRTTANATLALGWSSCHRLGLRSSCC
jgi:hypothetical protein